MCQCLNPCQVTTTSDVRGLLSPGDRVAIGTLEFTVHPTYPMTSTAFYLSSYHPTGETLVDVVVSTTAMTVRVGWWRAVARWAGAF